MRVKEKRDSSVTMFPQNDKESRMTKKRRMTGKRQNMRFRIKFVMTGKHKEGLPHSVRNDRKRAQ